jgi:hypothetical protein
MNSGIVCRGSEASFARRAGDWPAGRIRIVLKAALAVCAEESIGHSAGQDHCAEM